MDFFLQTSLKGVAEFSTEILRIDSREMLFSMRDQLVLVGKSVHTRVVSFHNNGVRAWIIGDPIIEKEDHVSIEKSLERADIQQLVQRIHGHYRMVVVDSNQCKVYVTSALFNILPVYFHETAGKVFISSNLELLSYACGIGGISKRFILENVLFYYPLFNHTVFERIAQLPCNHSICITPKGYAVSQHTAFPDWFVSAPRPWKKAAESMADLFLERVKSYLPEEPYIHSLTGGFDSRTLVASAVHNRRVFETYSFGNTFSKDAQVAELLSSKAGVRFNLIELDEGYVKHQSLKTGLEFVKNSSGGAGFARAHYLFAAKELAAKTRTIVTGNFGSEILRAAHNAGVMISKNLYHLFHSKTYLESIHRIEASDEFEWLNRDYFRDEWRSLKQDLLSLPVFNPGFSGLTLNQKFYLTVFEEIFRKYFGAEMMNQFVYLNNRTPYLDTTFVRELLTTGLAGVYSDFFENNPVKRFKGQILYASIIKNSYPVFSGIQTDKGYCPKDLLSWYGKINIGLNYFKKKLVQREDMDDPYSLVNSFNYNLGFFQNLEFEAAMFNQEKLNYALQTGKYSNDLSIVLSQSWYRSHLREGKMDFFVPSRC